MKKLIIFLLLLLSHIIFAQNTDNSQVDLRKMFKQKVEQIKQKDNSAAAKPDLIVKKSNQKKVTNLKKAKLAGVIRAKSAKKTAAQEQMWICCCRFVLVF